MTLRLLTCSLVFDNSVYEYSIIIILCVILHDIDVNRERTEQLITLRTFNDVSLHTLRFPFNNRRPNRDPGRISGKSFAAGNTGTIQHITNEPSAESSRSWITQRSSEQLVLRGHNFVFPRCIGM